MMVVMVMMVVIVMMMMMMVVVMTNYFEAEGNFPDVLWSQDRSPEGLILFKIWLISPSSLLFTSPS